MVREPHHHLDDTPEEKQAQDCYIFQNQGRLLDVISCCLSVAYMYVVVRKVRRTRTSESLTTIRTSIAPTPVDVYSDMTESRLNQVCSNITLRGVLFLEMIHPPLLLLHTTLQ